MLKLGRLAVIDSGLDAEDLLDEVEILGGSLVLVHHVLGVVNEGVWYSG